MEIFLICPVRDVPKETEEQIRAYVRAKEKEGHTVYWPQRDTDQNDPIGLQICDQNRRAIAKADEVHVWWHKKSEGSRFDLGMMFMALYLMPHSKRVVIANPDEVLPTVHKSFENVLRALAAGHR